MLRATSVSTIWAPLLGPGTDPATVQFLIESSDAIAERKEPPELPMRPSCTWGALPTGGAEPSGAVGAFGAGASAPDPEPSTLLVVLHRNPGESLGIGVSADEAGGPPIISEVCPS